MNRITSTAVWILQFLLAALFAVQGGLKLSGSPAWVSRFRAWGYPDHFYYVIGAVEVVGALALLIPRTTRLGAVLLMVVMTGATVTHAVHREPQLVTALVLLCLLTLTVYVRRRPAGETTRLPS
jgi:putative oxidoreductase